MDFIWFFLSGLFTGIANVIPGISGGTVLLIMGVYEKLINILSGFRFSKVSFYFLFLFSLLFPFPFPFVDY